MSNTSTVEDQQSTKTENSDDAKKSRAQYYRAWRAKKSAQEQAKPNEQHAEIMSVLNAMLADARTRNEAFCFYFSMQTNQIIKLLDKMLITIDGIQSKSSAPDNSPQIAPNPESTTHPLQGLADAFNEMLRKTPKSAL